MNSSSAYYLYFFHDGEIASIVILSIFCTTFGLAYLSWRWLHFSQHDTECFLVLVQWTPEKRRGYLNTVARENGKVSVTKYLDNKRAFLVSNLWRGVNEYSQPLVQGREIRISRPLAVEAYNSEVGGAELLLTGWQVAIESMPVALKGPYERSFISLTRRH